ncbi:MAG: hypothetical protein JXA49_03105 [Actinobacteria bacterium]|nr:hypothetical protein [Actinomycetota bacterium]
MAFMFFFVVAAAIAVFWIIFTKRERNTRNILEIILITSIVVLIGSTCLMAGLAHIFGGENIAADIGWQPSPFEFEVGIANIAIGILGILCIWLRGEMVLAAVVAGSTWMFGNMIGHIRQMVINDNYAPGNAGAFIWVANAITVGIVVLYIVFRIVDSRQRNSTKALNNAD